MVHCVKMSRAHAWVCNNNPGEPRYDGAVAPCKTEFDDGEAQYLSYLL